MPMRTSFALCSLVLAAAALTGCSTESEMRASDPAASDAGGSADDPTESPAVATTGMPTAIPAAEGEVATDGLVTVLDDGDGPELCLGAVAESLPPQCAGPTMTGWDWAAHPEREEQAGTRWGSFYVQGTFDGTTFAVTEAVPAALYDTLSTPAEEPLGTPCEEPPGGWVVDAATTSGEAMDATLQAASALPGYAMGWLDGNTVNLAVTEDPAGAEAKLRETWGGGLCVSEAEHTEAELQAIQGELNAVPGMLSVASTRPDVLELHVVQDDGSIQAWADETYGDGLVEVTSALVPLVA